MMPYALVVTCFALLLQTAWPHSNNLRISHQWVNEHTRQITSDLRYCVVCCILTVHFVGGKLCLPSGGLSHKHSHPLFRRSFFGETKGCDRACQKECVMVHNKYRANHGAPPLVFDQQLADEAQSLIDKGIFKHSDWVELKNKGEAFAWGSLFPTFTAVIKSWHDEGAYYDYHTGTGKRRSQVVNHFAQVVWKGAHKIGCARGGLYGEPWYVAHYDKAPLIGEPITIENIGKPKQDDGNWFKNGSPYDDELKNVQEV